MAEFFKNVFSFFVVLLFMHALLGIYYFSVKSVGIRKILKIKFLFAYVAVSLIVSTLKSIFE